ncbi:MAG: 50S ribosomal protein L21 [Candidatus Sumerlaeaceae bacterium]|jgi:large subunit ribosomal protein L21
MDAILRYGSTQYKVSTGQTLKLPLLDVEVGSRVELDDVLQVKKDNGEAVFGRPTVEGATVVAKVLRHGKDRKILVYTFKRRKGYEKRRGHRQPYTEVLIENIKL